MIFPVEIWGTVGQWVGSLLTSGSIFLAYLVYRGTVNREKRAQAALVTFESSISSEGVKGNVFNHSDAIIYEVYFVLRPLSKKAQRRARPAFTPVMPKVFVRNEGLSGLRHRVSETQYGTILPGSGHPIDVSETRLKASSFYEKCLMFTDAAGQRWVRFSEDGKLEEFKEPSRIKIRWIITRTWVLRFAKKCLTFVKKITHVTARGDSKIENLHSVYETIPVSAERGD